MKRLQLSKWKRVSLATIMGLVSIVTAKPVHGQSEEGEAITQRVLQLRSQGQEFADMKADSTLQSHFNKLMQVYSEAARNALTREHVQEALSELAVMTQIARMLGDEVTMRRIEVVRQVVEEGAWRSRLAELEPGILSVLSLTPEQARVELVARQQDIPPLQFDIRDPNSVTEIHYNWDGATMQVTRLYQGNSSFTPTEEMIRAILERHAQPLTPEQIDFLVNTILRPE